MRPYLSIGIFLFILYSSAAMAERLAVSASVANIRSGPGTRYDVIWQVGKYHPIQIINKSGKWYHFRDFEQDEGWIHQSLVNKTKAVITIKKKCNVRSKPTTRSQILFTVEKGIPFKAVKRKGDWIFIEHADGDTGWIHRSLVW